MPILPEHKELLLSQSDSKTLPEWYCFFDKQYTKKQICSFCYHNKKFIKKTFQEEKSQNVKKYNINQDYFKTWSRNMAYVLGLWFSSGCVYGGKMFDITLHKRDKYILKKVAEELQYKGSLYDSVDKQVSRINFSCVVIYNDIINLGGIGLVGFPNIPKEYLPDFIRGYFDGNGSVMNLKNNRLNSTFTCGNKKFLIKILEILREEAGVKGGSFDNSCCSLKFGKKDTICLGNYIYKNNPELFLLRKRKKFQQEEI